MPSWLLQASSGYLLQYVVLAAGLLVINPLTEAATSERNCYL
jgi:hypothetical protein